MFCVISSGVHADCHYGMRTWTYRRTLATGSPCLLAVGPGAADLLVVRIIEEWSGKDIPRYVGDCLRTPFLLRGGGYKAEIRHVGKVVTRTQTSKAFRKQIKTPAGVRPGYRDQVRASATASATVRRPRLQVPTSLHAPSSGFASRVSHRDPQAP